MAKRFRDTEIWKKEWFQKLSPTLKGFWTYICDNCDNSGVWEMNLDLAQYQIGGKIKLEEILSLFNGNIVRISSDKLFVIGFIDFQYGELKRDCIPHRNIFKLLEKHGIPYPYPIDTLSMEGRYPIDRVQDKDKDKEKEKEEEEGMKGGKKQFLDYVFLKCEEYDRLKKELGKKFVDECIFRLDAYLANNKKKRREYQDHNKVIRTWVIDETRKKMAPEPEKSKPPPPAPPTPEEIAEGATAKKIFDEQVKKIVNHVSIQGEKKL
jgi:hypothetical protein